MPAPTGSGTPKAKEQSQVQHQVDCIQETITLIEQRTDTLREHLFTVLRDDSDEGQDQEAIRELVPLAKDLAAIDNRLNNLRGFLDSIIERMEL